jgi:hypothetical protein
MGISKSVIIGPYLEAKGKITTTVPKVKRVCPSHPGMEFKDQRFCGKCGTEIINENYDSPVDIRARNIVRDFEDQLWEPEGLSGIFLPNSNPPGGIKISDDAVVELGPKGLEDLSMAQVEWFELRYLEIIEKVQDRFPDARVKWGIITFWS